MEMRDMRSVTTSHPAGSFGPVTQRDASMSRGANAPLSVRRISAPSRSPRLWALAAAACTLLLVAATPAKAETISGSFRFADRGRVDDESPDRRPIAHAKVEIWRCVPGFLGFCNWGNARTVKTHANGRISEWFDHRGTTYGAISLPKRRGGELRGGLNKVALKAQDDTIKYSFFTVFLGVSLGRSVGFAVRPGRRLYRAVRASEGQAPGQAS